MDKDAVSVAVSHALGLLGEKGYTQKSALLSIIGLSVGIIEITYGAKQAEKTLTDLLFEVQKIKAQESQLKNTRH